MQIAIRIAVVVFVVLPLVALGGAVFDSTSSPHGPSFLNTLITDLTLIYLYGLGPAIITSLLHTQITGNATHVASVRPRLRSTVYGCAIGVATGLGFGLVLSTIAVAFVMPLVLGAIVWGALGGALYGALVGPANRPERRAA